MAKDNKNARSAREAAAAARTAALEQQRKRQRIINIVVGSVIVVVVGAIIGTAVLLSQNSKKQSGVVADASAPVPTGVFGADGDYPFGVPLGANPDAPVLQLWEDLQCPACGQFERAAGEMLKGKAAAGEIFLVTRPTTFLDQGLRTDHSRRATGAYGCAIDAGKGYEYKETVYANQPAREGDGWTDEQLLGFGQQVGIEGDAYTTFEQCFNDRKYVPWAGNSTDEFNKSGINGTPTVLLNGEKISAKDVLDPAKFDELIKAAAQQ